MILTQALEGPLDRCLIGGKGDQVRGGLIERLQIRDLELDFGAHRDSGHLARGCDRGTLPHRGNIPCQLLLARSRCLLLGCLIRGSRREALAGLFPRFALLRFPANPLFFGPGPLFGLLLDPALFFLPGSQARRNSPLLQLHLTRQLSPKRIDRFADREIWRFRRAAARLDFATKGRQTPQAITGELGFGRAAHALDRASVGQQLGFASGCARRKSGGFGLHEDQVGGIHRILLGFTLSQNCSRSARMLSAEGIRSQ